MTSNPSLAQRAHVYASPELRLRAAACWYLRLGLRAWPADRRLSRCGRTRACVAGSLIGAGALEDMHARKTAHSSAPRHKRAPSRIDTDVVAAITTTHGVGLAFQIIDDVLDVGGSSASLGKTAGKDAAAGKPTYPALYGIEESRRLAAACVERSTSALARQELGGRLADIAAWSLTRRA